MHRNLNSGSSLAASLALHIDGGVEKDAYVRDVIGQIFEKDIRSRKRICNGDRLRAIYIVCHKQLRRDDEPYEHRWLPRLRGGCEGQEADAWGLSGSAREREACVQVPSALT